MKRLLISVIFLFGTTFGEAYLKLNPENSSLKKWSNSGQMLLEEPRQITLN